LKQYDSGGVPNVPKIDVHQETLFRYLGKSFSDDELEEILPAAKAELDAPVDENGIVKIELNDTNRPDLWSTAGLARQLGSYLGAAAKEYDFVSSDMERKDYGNRVVEVDPNLEEIRPFIAAFAVEGRGLSEAELDDLIQTQEKLCWNYGRKRSSIAMGVYRTDLITYPVHYVAADPDTTRFVPLGMDQKLSLRDILKEHPKGQEYGSIIADFEKYPYLEETGGATLSMPPIINSATVGAVEEGDQRLFIEMTGTDLQSLLVACNIVAADMADAGFTILPVLIRYPYDTAFGREIVTPYYFQEPVTVDLPSIQKLLGREVSLEEASGALARVGVTVRQDNGGTLAVMPPVYRNDFLHPVDVIEDVMIGLGMDYFQPASPHDFTVGRITPAEAQGRHVKSLMVGMGFQEMMFSYLGSYADFVVKMLPEEEHEGAKRRIVKVANPMSENYEYVRNSILPHLLSSESVSGNAAYPHRMFEVGKIVLPDEQDSYGSVTLDALGFLVADHEANYNSIHSQISTLLYYLRKSFDVAEISDSRFLPGRCASLVVGGVDTGFFGEIHPRVLDAWGIQMPCAGGELYLTRLSGT
jgi:phenylalanyl-tRNA synthetase beta chain